ncbi:hypothetical protein HDU79_003071 [Rhizoclosmatium sp. JEL0117]|nr:hypothetical protein HDU79_003071 [Rhizoclosmatium sp. JEL0117]
MGILNTTITLEPMNLRPYFVRCTIVRAKSAGQDNDSGYGFCTIIFLGINSLQNMDETFIVVEKIFHSPDGLLKSIDFSESHRIGGNSGFEEFTAPLSEYQSGFPIFKEYLYNNTGRANWQVVATKSWKSTWTARFKFDGCIKESENKELFLTYMDLPIGDRIVVRRHTTPTSVTMNLDSEAKYVHDVQLYVISNPYFLGACIGTLGICILVLLFMDTPSTLCWALAFKDGFECSTKKPKEDFMVDSVWKVNGFGDGAKISLEPKDFRENEREFSSHAAAIRALKMCEREEAMNGSDDITLTGTVKYTPI